MTNATPKTHINIKAGEQVSSVSTGKIQGTNWSPNAGYAREKEIEEARIAAQAEYQARNSFESRFELMEGAIADLQQKYEELKNA